MNRLASSRGGLVFAAPRRVATDALLTSEYRDLFHGGDQGFCVFEMIVDADGRPTDYRFLEVNRAFADQTGLVDAVGRTARELVPNLEAHWVEMYGAVAQTGVPVRFAQEPPAMGRSFDVYASRIGAADRRLVALTFTETTTQRRDHLERVRAEQALRQAEFRLRAFADTAPAMLWVTETDGRCSHLSRNWYAFTGQAEGEGLDFGWLDAVHPDDRDRTRVAFTRATVAGASFELEHRLRRGDGEYRWVIDAGRPRYRDDGTFNGYVGSVIDIHDRRTTEARLDFAVTAGEVGLWSCDLPFDVLVWNANVKAHFGLPPDADVTIDIFYERIHPDDREQTRTAITEAIARRSTYDTQYRTIGLDGVTRWIRAIGRARIEHDRPVRFDGITVDITELVALRESAEAASRAKDDFLAMLGHELRNPLAPMLTALELLKLRGIAAVEHERSVLDRQVRHLARLVDDLLDVSRITRGMVDLRREDVIVADAVARGAEMAGPLLEQRRHTLSVDVPRHLLVEGDPGRLAQVVANLLSNAAKYTDPDGDIAVTAVTDGDGVRLSVRDSGVGIDPAMLPVVFDLFAQERQSLARSDGGLGIGLAIVRSLVELHGGTVRAFSEGRGRGSEFTMWLPAAPIRQSGSRRSSRQDAAPPDPTVGMRVLVVDDNADAAVMLGRMLSLFGYDARVVADGPSALVEAVRFQPDVALVDLGLPVMDGFELAERLAALSARPVALVAVTGYGQERDRSASARAGFAAHLVKPVEMEDLRRVLGAVLPASTR